MKTITFRHFPISEGNSYEEYTVDGNLGKVNKVTGYVDVVVKKKVIATVHWTNIKDYFPEKPGYF